jgi:glutamine cyclotransferase
VNLKIINELEFIKGKVYKNFDLKNLTTFKIGGKVDYLIMDLHQCPKISRRAND